jgi:preprotein translocase subunit SecY
MITQYTRYGTLVIGAIQALFTSFWLENLHNTIGIQIVQYPGWGFRLVTILTLVSGTAFIMWLGEQMTEFGIGTAFIILTLLSYQDIDCCAHSYSLLRPNSRRADVI